MAGRAAATLAKVVTAENGKRHIESNAQGTPFNVFTPGCQSGRCTSIEIVAAFATNGKFDVSQLNQWNSVHPLVQGLLRQRQRSVSLIWISVSGLVALTNH